MTNKEAIMILESVQPSCGEKYSYSESEIYEAIDMAISALVEQRWISCEERYPEPDENVLVTIEGYGCYIWSRISNPGDNYFWEDESGFYHEKDAVVAWMPLPKAWKGVGK